MSGFAIGGPRQGTNRLPALLAAIALHLGLLAAVMFGANAAPPPIGSSVPINIVSSEPFTDTRPAEQAPQTVAAAAPAPVPQAPPQPPAPQVQPLPAFSKSPPTPPKKVEKPTPAPQPAMRAAAAPPAKPFDFNHLQQIIENARRTSSAPTSSAARGPARVETAPQARPNAGQGISQSDLAGLQQLLERLWVLECGEPGVDGVAPFKVTFTVTLDGRLLSPPSAHGAGAAGGMAGIVVRRALDAVRAAEPLAPPYYGQTITVTFNPKKAHASKCSD